MKEGEVAKEMEKVLKGNRLAIVGHGERGSSESHTAGVSAVSPQMINKQGDKEQEGGGVKDEEEMQEGVRRECAGGAERDGVKRELGRESG